MKLTNFEIAEDNIAIQSGEEYLDLHNCFGFVSFRRELHERIVYLDWSKRDGDWVPENYPEGIRIRVDDVQIFKSRERDADAPITEDGCLNCIGFMWNNLVEEMGAFASHRPQENCTHLSLEFMSGLALKISGESATLIIHRAETMAAPIEGIP